MIRRTQVSSKQCGTISDIANASNGHIENIKGMRSPICPALKSCPITWSMIRLSKYGRIGGSVNVTCIALDFEYDSSSIV